MTENKGYRCLLEMRDGSERDFTYYKSYRDGSRMVFTTATEVLTFEDEDVAVIAGIQLGEEELVAA